MTDTALDYYPGQTTPARCACFKANGHRAVVLYLNRCTRAEVDAVLDAGLELHFVYETNPTYPGYFSPSKGTADAIDALLHLEDKRVPRVMPFGCRVHGRPHGPVVYFTVDTHDEPPPALDPYWNAIEEQLANVAGSRDPFRWPLWDGLYGFREHIVYAAAHFGNAGGHLWQTYGNTLGAVVDLWQFLQRDLCGATVDVNEIFIAGWRKDEDMLTDKQLAILAKLEERPDVVAALIDGGNTVRYILHGANDQGPGSYADTLERIARLEDHVAIPVAPGPAPASPVPPAPAGLPPLFTRSGEPT